MKRLLCVVFAGFLAACGGGGSSTPTAPTPAAPVTPTVTGLTISGLDAIRSGFFTPYTATQTMSNGTTQPATAVTWSSNNTNVATVATNGDVTGVLNANGTATITATAGNVTATKGIRVVANFGGQWGGTYRVNKCDESGNWRGIWCTGIGGVGAILPMSMNMTQGGAGRDQISGNISLGTLNGTISGNITGDGRLILGGTFTTASGNLTLLFTFGGWDTRLTSTGGMTGGWAHTLSASGFTGNVFQENTIVAITHINQGTTVAQREP